MSHEGKLNSYPETNYAVKQYLKSIPLPLPNELVNLITAYDPRPSVICIGRDQRKLSSVHTDEIVHLSNPEGKFEPSTLLHLLASCKLCYVSANCFADSKASKRRLKVATKDIVGNAPLFHTVMIIWDSSLLDTDIDFHYMTTWLRKMIKLCGLSFHNFLLIHENRITNFSSSDAPVKNVDEFDSFCITKHL